MFYHTVKIEMQMKREPDRYTKQAQCRLYNFTVIFQKKKQHIAKTGTHGLGCGNGQPQQRHIWKKELSIEEEE